MRGPEPGLPGRSVFGLRILLPPREIRGTPAIAIPMMCFAGHARHETGQYMGSEQVWSEEISCLFDLRRTFSGIARKLSTHKLSEAGRRQTGLARSEASNKSSAIALHSGAGFSLRAHLTDRERPIRPMLVAERITTRSNEVH